MATSESKSRGSYKQLSLQQLQSFCEICRRGGYAPAARELFLTSPAVWEQMKALERYFEVKLLERYGNGVRPTSQGARLLKMVRPLLAELASTKEMLHQQDGAVPPQLTVVSNLRVMVEEISRCLFRFRRRYPTLQLRVRYIGGDEVQPLVLAGEADIVLTLEPAADESVSAAIEYESAGELDYLLVTPPRHELVRRRPLSLKLLVEYPLVVAESSAYSRRRVEEVFHRHNLVGEMNIVVETSSDEYTLSCVRAGLGVGIVVGKAEGKLHRGMGVRSLRRWFGGARVGFMWQRGAHIPPVQREFSDLLKDALSSNH